MVEKKEICYWCGKEATTREHVPPKCLFPQNNDIKNLINENFRNNLITVPSCDLHNIEKSNEDEYLMACLAGRVGNNNVAYFHTATKIKRARDRNPHLLEVEEDTTLKVGKTIFPVQWVNVDNYRLIKSFEAIARALYYYEYSKCFEGECNIVSSIFFHPNEIKSNVFYNRASKMIENERGQWGALVKGTNPKIFTYQLSPPDGFGIITIAMNFYENTKVYAILSDTRNKNLIKHKNTLKAISDILFRDAYDKKDI